MPLDQFSNVVDSISAPASASASITPSDATPLAAIPRAIYVGTGGDLAMRGKRDAADQIWRNVPSGALLPFRPTYVRATGTTAANLLALY